MGRWDVAGLLEPALGPFGARSEWERREADGAVLVTTEFKLRPRAPKPRLCKLFYKVIGSSALALYVFANHVAGDGCVACAVVGGTRRLWLG